MTTNPRNGHGRVYPPARRTAPRPVWPAWPVLDQTARFSSSLELGAFGSTPRFAREHTREVLGEWGLGELADEAEVVIAELTANAVQATVRAGLDTPVRVTLLAGLRAVLIVVWDAAADLPVLGGGGGFVDLDNFAGDDAADPDQHGRGLVLVEALSFRWGFRPMRGGLLGKAVWSEIRGKRPAVAKAGS
jgi:anti-sigma regulatory factor (Ser/Thr protein kinase)